ncbi:MAG: mechanosensitive ion channel family protein [Holosporales bacterium]|jgi:small-conductance mechanosensitive channel|nr:mechanosensitive ion channel family protein [Holosporales bacterium]
MESSTVRKLIVGLLLIALLIACYVWSSRVSADNVGVYFDYEKLIRTVIVGLITFVTIRIVFFTLIRSFEIKNNKRVPGILKDMLGIFIFLVAVVFVVTNIYSQSAMLIFIGLGASGIGIAYVAQDLLKELLAGVVISYQNDFRVGDWIKFPDGTIGKIIKTKLTGLDLILLDDTVLYISNTTITGQPMINLSQLDKPFYDGVKVMLEHDVPVERARRILYAACVNIPKIENREILVFAESVHVNGIVFAIFFKALNYDVLREIKHCVISSVVRQLHKYGLKICELSGQYNIHNIQPESVKKYDDFHVTDAFSVLQFSSLLKNCGGEVQRLFAQNMNRLFYEKDEIIFSQGEDGDTMFIVAEGVVEVKINISVEEERVAKSTTNTIAVLSDGDYFGEMALLCGEKRSATVTAKTDAVMYEINRQTIKFFVAEYPDFAMQLSKAIMERRDKNELLKSETIEELKRKESTITEFMNAFKSFLKGE